MGDHRCELGVFLPLANGGWIISSTTPPLDGLWKQKAFIAEAELDGLMLIFPDYVEGLKMFGADILPAYRLAHV